MLQCHSAAKIIILYFKITYNRCRSNPKRIAYQITISIRVVYSNIGSIVKGTANKVTGSISSKITRTIESTFICGQSGNPTNVKSPSTTRSINSLFQRAILRYII